MLLYDVVDFESTSLTMKKDGASQNRPSVETGYDRGDAPSTTSISDLLIKVNKKHQCGLRAEGSNCPSWFKPSLMLMGA